jgi:hypothetical protein
VFGVARRLRAGVTSQITGRARLASNRWHFGLAEPRFAAIT